MKNKIRSYGFWTALAGALVVLINAIGKCFGFSVQEELVSNIVMALAGILVVFGVVAMPKKEEDSKTDNSETSEDQEQLDEQTENEKIEQVESKEDIKEETKE